MRIRPTRIFPLGDAAVTVEFGKEMLPELNDAAVSVADHFTANPFPGFIEAVPAIASATIFYSTHAVERSPGETAFDRIQKLVLDSLDSLPDRRGDGGRTLTIPVSFAPEHALDLRTVAEFAGLPVDEVIDSFISEEYRVFMLGFLPGFAYIGPLDERITAPRLASPRAAVPKGSVGIAGRQTGIYPAVSPGGWQIIGRTDIELFDPANDPPARLLPGDRVRFVRA